MITRRLRSYPRISQQDHITRVSPHLCLPPPKDRAFAAHGTADPGSGMVQGVLDLTEIGQPHLIGKLPLRRRFAQALAQPRQPPMPSQANSITRKATRVSLSTEARSATATISCVPPSRWS